MAKNIKKIKELAESGDNNACYELGCEYFTDSVKDGKDSDKEAFNWFEKAAEQGHAEAEYMYGLCLLNGTGVMFGNAKSSLKYFLSAAEKGHVGAMVKLCDLYSHELFCTEWDFNEALRWIKKAAQAGNVKAEYEFGRILVEGFPYDFKKKFKKLNPEEGIVWLEKAADKGYLFAADKLGDVYYYGKGVEKDVKTALSWYERGGADRNGGSYLKIGNIYLAEGDYKKALEYFLKSEDLCNTGAILRLGDCYYRGWGVEQDFDKALEYYKSAAKCDDYDFYGAKSNLALMYATDTPFKDDREAVIWLHYSYNYTKNPEIFYEVAKRHTVGYDFRDDEHTFECYVFRKDFEEAAYYFKKAGNMGHIPSCLEYAKRLLDGVGVKADRKEAIKWFKKASEGGSEEAKIYLKQIQG